MVTKNKTALVVDDDANIRLTLNRVLEEMQFTVETASQGKEALKKLRRSPYNLVLLDLNLPAMEGLEVLQHLKQEQIPTRVIVITAYGSVDRAVEAMQLGAAEFIQKPFELDEIRVVITRTLAEKPPWTEKQLQRCLETIRDYLRKSHFAEARSLVQMALNANPDRAEIYNLLGVLLEAEGQTRSAQKIYRASLAIEPTYQPAAENLDRVSSSSTRGKLHLGD